jgi:hypothetical protein
LLVSVFLCGAKSRSSSLTPIKQIYGFRDRFTFCTALMVVDDDDAEREETIDLSLDAFASD